MSTYSQTFVPVLANFQLSFLGSCWIILERKESILARMTLRIPGHMFSFITVYVELTSIIEDPLGLLPITSWKEASPSTGIKY